MHATNRQKPLAGLLEHPARGSTRKILEQGRETPREYLNLESHCLLYSTSIVCRPNPD